MPSAWRGAPQPARMETRPSGVIFASECEWYDETKTVASEPPKAKRIKTEAPAAAVSSFVPAASVSATAPELHDISTVAGLADMVKGLSDANAVTLRRLLEARALLALASARGSRPTLVPGAA